ncbi:MAG: hypothetical protein JWP00_4059 [Chloroflexi bacterium]|jgi:uncharacterized Zn finger protein|nr:hypothetical protein [Chloroflexota bacterium]
MICPVCKEAEMQQVAETSPQNITLKCLNCGAEVMKATTDNTTDAKQYAAVFVRQPDGSMKQIYLDD